MTSSMRTIGSLKVRTLPRSSDRMFPFGGVRCCAVVLLYFGAVQRWPFGVLDRELGDFTPSDRP
jgi:hypothetical protein